MMIGQLARAGAVPISTVRYYERIGILQPQKRVRGSYRTYTTEALARLRFIRAAQDAGFTLGQIRSLLEYQQSGAARCEDVGALIRDQLTETRQRIRELRATENSLISLAKACLAADGSERCNVVQSLEATSRVADED